MRIEINGAIGSGKSSLAKLLLDHGYSVVFEEFKANPFWKAFYLNPGKYNFETEITFILQHYHDLKRKLEESEDIVCDFSFTQDMGYAAMDLKGDALKIFNKVHDYIIRDVGEPTLLIYMECSVEGLINRIKTRGREEEILISEDFLIQLIYSIKKHINKRRRVRGTKIKFFEINTEKINIISNPSDKKFILSKISELIAG